ncbi:MAG: hypothetical protein OFPII_43540 [Osedax symbiont Rs1]|nr:MAG: hypothetical protein OFPII_43540 [Osedax symbiont Rs1]
MYWLDLGALRKACCSLEMAVENALDNSFVERLSESQKQLIIAGVILNFEFTYELVFKMIKRQLELDAASPSEVDQYSFRDLLRTAAERGIIENVEVWFEYRRLRNITSHTYNLDKAQEVFKKTIIFKDEALTVLAELTKRND